MVKVWSLWTNEGLGAPAKPKLGEKARPRGRGRCIVQRLLRTRIIASAKNITVLRIHSFCKVEQIGIESAV